MSTTSHFKYYRPYPFCPQIRNVDTRFFYPGSAAELMAIAWNLEDLRIDLDVSITTQQSGYDPVTAYFEGTYRINPLTLDGCFADYSTVTVNNYRWFSSMFFGAYGAGAIGSAPGIKEPFERVCFTAPGLFFNTPLLYGQRYYNTLQIDDQLVALIQRQATGEHGLYCAFDVAAMQQNFPEGGPEGEQIRIDLNIGDSDPSPAFDWSDTFDLGGIEIPFGVRKSHAGTLVSASYSVTVTPAWFTYA